MGVAELVRLAVVMSLDLRPPAAVVEGSDGQTPACNPAQRLTRAPIRTPSELTLGLPQAYADALMLNVGALALSHGECSVCLVSGSE
jgi:hypothetical protein